MIKKGSPGLHCILIIAKRRHAVCDEIVERLECVRTRHRPAKRLNRAIMCLEPLFDECDHILRDSIDRKPLALWRLMILWQGLAVLGIEIPRAADGVIAFHQEARLLPHVTIEIFHPQLLAAFRPLRKLFERCDETLIVVNGERHRQCFTPILHHLQNAPLTRFRHDDALRLVPFDGA